MSLSENRYTTHNSPLEPPKSAGNSQVKLTIAEYDMRDTQLKGKSGRPHVVLGDFRTHTHMHIGNPRAVGSTIHFIDPEALRAIVCGACSSTMFLQSRCTMYSTIEYFLVATAHDV